MLLLLLSIPSCSFPRIIILDDPLSAAEHNDLGISYEAQGIHDLAEKEYARAYRKQKNWIIPYFNLANLYFKNGDYKKSENFYRRALAIDKNNPDVLNNLAYLLYVKEDYKESMILIEKALQIEEKEEYRDTYNKIFKELKSITQNSAIQ